MLTSVFVDFVFLLESSSTYSSNSVSSAKFISNESFKSLTKS
ncbi:hypothetical protein [Mycoplasmopsis felis]|nr:hypothetical protein [Mycoplasmopsis felis]UWV83556.1 hypothetical protein NWE58_04445 [Mycoplasmopsis felis]